MSQISDLVADSKLETRFHPQFKYVYHIYSESDSARGQRAVLRREYWQRRKHIGSGGFGSVWLEQCVKGDQEGEVRAVKEIQRPRNKFECNRELEAIAKFSHRRYARCFVKSYGWYEQGNTFYLAMEYFPLGDLQTYLNDADQPLPETEVQQIVYQILEGLKFMHTNGFAHRDIKPANILVQSKPPESQWWIKISDFGISKRFRDSQGVSSTVKGTLAFMAPELHGFKVPGRTEDPPCPNSVDIWALGEITHQLLTRQQVFGTIATLYNYIQGIQPFPTDRLQSQNASTDAISLIRNMMYAAPIMRCTSEQALQTQWFAQLHPPPSPPPEELDLPEIPEMIAAMGLDEASNKWSTLTGTLEFLDETTTQKSIKTDGMKTLKGDIPSDLAGRQPENIASDSVPQTSPAGPQPSKAQPENTVVRADKPDDYIKPPDSHKRVQLLCICEDSLTNKSENFVFQFSADLRQAVFGYQNGTVELYNIPEQRLVSRFAIHLVITSITMDPFNERIACGHQSMRFTVWDYHGNSLIHKGDVTTEPVTAISFVREVHWLGGPGVLTFTKSALPSIWDERRATTQSSQSFTFIQADTTKRDPSLDCVAISQDTNFLAIFMPMYEDSGIAIIDLRKDEVVSLTPLPPNWNKFTVIFSWDGSLLAYTGSSSIIVWDIVLKRIVHEISADGYQYLDLAFSHDGLLLAGSWTRKAKSGIHLWDCITGERKLCILDACVRCIAFSGDDSLIGVGSPPSRGVRGWNVRGIYRIASTADIESFAKKKSFEDRAGSPRAMGNKLTKPGGRHLDDEAITIVRRPPGQQSNLPNSPQRNMSPSHLSHYQPQALTVNSKNPTFNADAIKTFQILRYRKEGAVQMNVPKLCDLPEKQSAMSPDGTIYAAIERSGTLVGVSRIFREDKRFKLYSMADLVRGKVGIHWVAVCANRLACGFDYGNAMEWDLEMRHNPTQLQPETNHLNTTGVKMAAYSRDGRILAYLAYRGYTVTRELSKEESPHIVAGPPPRRSETRIFENPAYEFKRLALSQSGVLLAIAWVNKNGYSGRGIMKITALRVQDVLNKADPDINEQPSVFTPELHCHAMTFSPDGRLLAVVTGKELIVLSVQASQEGLSLSRIKCIPIDVDGLLGTKDKVYLCFCPKSTSLAILMAGSLEYKVLNCYTGTLHIVAWKPRTVNVQNYWLDGPMFFTPQGGLMAFCCGGLTKRLGIYELAGPSDIDDMEADGNKISSIGSEEVKLGYAFWRTGKKT